MWKRGYACRCCNRKCSHYLSFRKTLRYKPSHYLDNKEWHALCPWCKKLLAIDIYRTSGRENKKNKCNCNSPYGYTHRRGSLYCMFYKGTEEALKWGKFGHHFRE